MTGRRSYEKDRLDDSKDVSKNGGQSSKRTRDEEIILKSGSTPSHLFDQVGYASHNTSFIGLQKVLLSLPPLQFNLIEAVISHQ